MPSSQPKIRFEDIIANIERIMFYIEGHDKDSFIKDIRTADAVERCLQRITEAAIKLQPLAGDLLPDQNWKAMRDLGNMLRHHYERILSEEIWRIVEVHLPGLLDGCKHAVSKIEEEEADHDM